MTEQFFEMLWDCPQCEAQGLLGTSHRHCPACGAAQDPKKRYFPLPGQEVAAKDHRFAGADWACPYCATPNAAAAAFCVNCGGPKDGSKAVGLVQDKAAAAPPLVKPPASPTAGFSWLKKLLALLAMIGLVLAYQFFSKHDEGVQIVEKTWSRSIDVERFTSVSGSDWCNVMPADAYQVSRSREQRSTRQVESGQNCVEVRTDVGDGSFTKRRECTPRYRTEPVLDDKCSYRLNRWQLARTDRLAGAANQIPAWPTPALDQTFLGGNRLGAERLGTRRESYQIRLQSAQSKNWTCELSPARWAALAPNQRLTLKVRGTGGADCDSLAARP